MPVVFTAANPVEAHLCQQFLEEQGIEARVDGEILWMSRGEFPLNEATTPRVNVSHENAARALELIEQFRKGHLETGVAESWVCPKCQERNPPGFQVCWHCQTAGDSSQIETSM